MSKSLVFTIDDIHKAYEAGFHDGFKVSGEGFNNDYPKWLNANLSSLYLHKLDEGLRKHLINILSNYRSK